MLFVSCQNNMYEFTTEMTNVVKTKSSVHFSPKKAYLLPLNTREKENIIKNTTATEKEELKLKKQKQDTYYKILK